MKLQLKPLSVVILLLLSIAGCQTNPHRSADFAFIGVNIVDVKTGNIKTNQVVLIAEGKILDVSDFDQSVLPANLNTVFAQDQYLMPGLMDSHVHAFADPQTAINKTLPLFIANGVTHIRDMGSTLEDLDAIANLLAADPSIAAPNYISTGPLIDGKKLSWYRDLQTVVSSEQEVSFILDQLEDAGIQQIKAYSNLSPQIYRTLAIEAKTRDLTVVGHLSAGVSIETAATLGHKTIEHLDIGSTVSCATIQQPWLMESITARFQQGYDQYFELMTQYWQQINWQTCSPHWLDFARSGGYLTPTLIMETSDQSLVDEASLIYLSHDARAWCEKTLKDVAASTPENQHSAYSGLKVALDKIRSTGTPILAGTDTPNHCLVPGFSLSWELNRMVDFGLTPLQAIQTATVHPAEAFWDAPRLVEPGQPAELIVLAANPIVDVSAVKQVRGVYSQQRWWDDAALMKLKTQAKQFVTQSNQQTNANTDRSGASTSSGTSTSSGSP